MLKKKSNNLSQSIIENSMLKILSHDYLALGVLRMSTGECILQANNSDVSDQISKFIDAGNTYDNVILKYIEEYVYIEDRTAAYNSLSRSNICEEMKSVDRIHFVIRRHSVDRTLKFTRIEIIKIPDASDEFLFTFTDIDDEMHQDMLQKEQLQKAYRETERASQAKNEFMHNMSHDIRTPLNAIVGYTAIASDHVDDPVAMKEYLSKIYNSSQNLLHIVNDILDMGDLDSKNIRFNETALTMRALVNQIVSTIEGQISDKQLKLNILMDANDTTPLIMDSLYIEKIFTNILSNSIKFTENHGEITFAVKSKPLSNNILHYTFTIEDTGIGISSEFLDKVFNPYEREKTSTQSRKEGVGIGLTIVKNIVNALNGTISVDSEVNRGSKFTVDLDFKVAIKAAPSAGSDKAVPAVNNVKGKRILVVDDSKVNRDIATAILEGFKAKIEVASDGDIAVQMYEASKPGYYDMVLMDIQMPQMDGYDATRSIRRINRSDAKTVPIVALTADVFESTKRTAMEVGMNDFLTKPINVKNLTETLVRFFN